MKSEKKFVRLLEDKPILHDWASTFQINIEVLKYIFQNTTPDMTSLETGAGATTVTFAIARTLHTCITPAKSEKNNIIDYCHKMKIETDNITFIIRSSDIALPDMYLTDTQLDFVFIDGAHRFPYPIIDWHYTENRLKIGGILGLDDVAMPSIRVLYDFLCGEDEWEIIKKIGDTAFFLKTDEAKIISDWQGQNINRDSNWSRKTGFIKSCKHTIKKLIKPSS